jgi:hypothetical protein
MSLLSFDIQYIAKSKGRNTLPSFSNVVDSSAAILSILGDAMAYYAADNSGNDYFDENKHLIQSLFIEIYKNSPECRELVYTPIHTEEIKEELRPFKYDEYIMKRNRPSVAKMLRDE